MNPSFYSISKVLEKQFADTSDFVDHIEIVDDGSVGSKKINEMNNRLF